MRDKRISVFPLIILVAALVALVLPSAFLQDGARASATRESNPDPNQQVMRIGKPTPTPTPAKKSTVFIGRPAAGANKTPPPPPPSMIIDLKDEPDEKTPVWLHADKFNAPNAKNDFSSPPFTASELIAADTAAGTKRITKRQDKTYWVKYMKGPDGGKKEEAYVEIEKYVAQLNQYEKTLNDAGCSLRKGPLAVGAVAAAGSVKQTNTNLGGANTLERRQPMGPVMTQCGVPFKLKNRFLPPKEIVVYHDPNLIYRVPSLEEYARFVRARLVNPASGRVGGRPTMNRTFGVPTRRVLLAGGLPGRYRTLDSRAGDCKPKGEELPPAGARNPVCPGPTGEDCPPAPNYGGENNDTGKPCGDKKPDNKLKCLHDGVLAAEWPAAFSTCINAGGGNGWFGASLCAESSFFGEKSSKSPVSLSSTAGAHLDVTMLGMDLEVLSISGQGGYENGQPENNGPHVTLFDGATLPATDFNKSIRFLGPQAFIMIGPVPISLKTGFDANFGLSAKPNVSPQLPGCGGGSSKFGLGFELNADANIWAEAALDIYVASAGVSAKLVLTDDRLNMFMDTEVRPSTNDIIVSTGYNYDAEHLKGVLTAFVQVDLLVYKERFDIELFSFGGFKTQYPKAGDESVWTTTFGAWGPTKVE